MYIDIKRFKNIGLNIIYCNHIPILNIATKTVRSSLYGGDIYYEHYFEGIKPLFNMKKEVMTYSSFGERLN